VHLLKPIVEVYNSTMAKTIESREQPSEIKRFSPETRRRLENMGYTIIELTGRSFREIYNGFKELHRLVDFAEMRHYKPFVEAAGPSIQSEIAIRPNNFYLKGSQNKDESEWEKMLAVRLKDLQKSGVTGVNLIVGSLSDYLETISKYFDHPYFADLLHDVYGEYKYIDVYIPGKIRVKCDVPGYKSIQVGHPTLGRDYPILIYATEQDDWDNDAHIAPLIVPLT